MPRRHKNSSVGWMSPATTSAGSTPYSSRFPSTAPSRAASPGPLEPFRLMDLPTELRLRIYEFALFMSKPIDLDPLNHRLVHPRLALFLACHKVYEESYPIFYAQPMRLYPTHPQFFHTRKPLLARLPTHYRSVITTMELRLGPGWTAPPACQNTSAALGLRDCTSLRTLKIFIECDPSDTYFMGFRGKGATEDTYKQHCAHLVLGVLTQVPNLEIVEIDAYPSVKKDAPLVLALRRKVDEAGKKLVWGPLRGWEKENDEPGLIGLEKALAGMGISDVQSRLVGVPA